MADLALKDRLQPALLDRLIDDERMVALVRLETAQPELDALGLPLQGLIDVLAAQGLTLERSPVIAERIELQFTAPQARAGPARLRALVIQAPATPQGVTLESFAIVETKVVPNTALESADGRMISMRKLRESVHRDLGWLLNSASLDSTEDLATYPEVARSVLNFGMPSFAGLKSASIDRQGVARRLRHVIEQYEPRLTSVRVRAEPRQAGEDDGTLQFVIEAELWGQPVSQHLELRTKIDVITGDVSVTDSTGH